MQDEEGKIPLHYAVEYENINAINLLVSRDEIDVNIQDGEGKTPWRCAFEQGYREPIMALLNSGKISNALLPYATVLGYEDIMLSQGKTQNQGSFKEIDDAELVPFTEEQKKISVELIEFLTQASMLTYDEHDKHTDEYELRKEKEKEVNKLKNFLVECQKDEKLKEDLKVVLNAKKGEFASKFTFNLPGYPFQAVDLLLEAGMDPNISGEEVQTPLHYAVDYGCIDIVKSLLKSDRIDVNARDDDGRTPLCAAAGCYHNDIVTLLLESNVIEINARDNGERTPLHIAVERGCSDIVASLIKSKKIEINARDNGERTPLHIAVERGCSDIVASLIKSKKIEINARDNYARTPLHIAAMSNSIDIAESILSKEGVDIDIQDAAGKTPLHYASEESYEGLVDILLLKKAKVDIKDNDDYTPLHYAAHYGHLQTVCSLVGCTQDINCQDFLGGDTALHFALWQSKDSRLADAILEKYQKNDAIDITDASGRTPLLLAAEYSEQSILEQILGKGANINHKDNDGNTALHYAIHNAYTGESCCTTSNHARVSENEEYGVDNREDNYKSGHTNANLLISTFYKEIDKRTREEADEKEADKKEADSTDLIGNAMKKADEKKLDGDVRNKFIKKYAMDKFINAKNKDGFTPIFFAVENGDIQVVKLLLEKGADINIQNKHGRTLLSYVKDNKVESLLKNVINGCGHWSDGQLMSAVNLKREAIQTEPEQSDDWNKEVTTECIVKSAPNIAVVRDNPDNSTVIDIADNGTSNWRPNTKLDAIKEIPDSELRERLDKLKKVAESAVYEGKLEEEPEIKDASFFRLKYAENSIIDVVKIAGGAKDLNLHYGTIEISDSKIEFELENGLRNYTKISDGGDITLTFHTNLGKVEVRLYPGTQDRIIVEVSDDDRKKIDQLENKDRLGRSCRFGAMPVYEAIMQGWYDPKSFLSFKAESQDGWGDRIIRGIHSAGR